MDFPIFIKIEALEPKLEAPIVAEILKFGGKTFSVFFYHIYQHNIVRRTKYEDLTFAPVWFLHVIALKK